MRKFLTVLCVSCLVGFMSQGVEGKSLAVVNTTAVTTSTSGSSAEKSSTGIISPLSKKTVTPAVSKPATTPVASKPITTTTKAPAAPAKVAPAKEVPTKVVKESTIALGEPYIRVLVKGAPQVELRPSVVGKNISIRVNDKEVMNFPTGTKLTATRKGQDIYLNNKKVGPVLTITGDKPVMVEVDGRAYRGTVNLTTTLSKTNIAVINVVPMESYLYGVVPEEVVPSWHRSALEAQSVAARSYAYHAMQGRAAYSYDVESDTRSQVYKGMSSEYGTTTKAVDATKGMVMTYGGKVINALFHSDSGGYTENSEKVWGNSIPYLRAVEDPVKGVNTSTYRWTVKTDKKRLEAILKQAGKDVGSLKEIHLSPLGKRPLTSSDRGASGRVLSMIVEGTKGKATITGIEMMGYLGLKSTLFDFYVGNIAPVDIDTIQKPKTYHSFSSKNDAVVIQGYGWGHGLGMSQWGAQGMATQAKAGDSDYYKKILLHYYTGVTLKKLY